jgi:hypothetical protein
LLGRQIPANSRNYWWRQAAKDGKFSSAIAANCGKFIAAFCRLALGCAFSQRTR